MQNDYFPRLMKILNCTVFKNKIEAYIVLFSIVDDDKIQYSVQIINVQHLLKLILA